MSSLLWTAWVEAGSPELTGFSPSCMRTSPQGDIVIRGYPPSGGFFHVDAGSQDAGSPDAGREDPGVDAGAGGQGGGGGGEGEPVGCSCTSFASEALLALVALLAFTRRRA